MPTSTDLVTDLPADFEVFGQAVDTSLADLKGGTTGQVLKKNSNTDMDFVWGADSAGMTNPMTTTGDTIYSSSGSTPARLGIGSTGQVLTVSSGLPAWATLATDKTIAQIASGTMPSASSLSLSSLSTYDTIIVRLDGLTWATTNASIMVTINNDTAANYELVGGYNQTTYSAYIGSTSTNYFYAGFGAASQNRTDANNYRFYVFTNCKAAGFTTAVINEGFVSSGGDTPNANATGIYKSAAAVSSIQFKTSTGNNYTAGNYVIWGG
jgi:hypothetical protein